MDYNPRFGFRRVEARFQRKTMSQHHHPDPIEENIDTHPVKLAIGIVVGAFALIVGIILLAQFAVNAYGGRSLKNDPSMSAENVAKRIAPVAQVEIDPNAPAAPAPGAAPAAAAASMVVAAIPPPAPGKAAVAGGPGKDTFDKACAACHATGVAGAPKFGDKAAWAPRVAQGKDALHASALKGKGAMPPKGGNTALPDADVKAAVDYMVAAAK
jgi:cytochrome c5